MTTPSENDTQEARSVQQVDMAEREPRERTMLRGRMQENRSIKYSVVDANNSLE